MSAPQARHRIVVLTLRDTTFDPDRYLQLSAVADVTLVELAAHGVDFRPGSAHESLREIIIPRSAQQAETERAIIGDLPLNVSRASLIRLLPSTPAYGEALRVLESSVDLAFVADAALGDVAAAMLRVPLVYDAPRIEHSVPSINTPGSHAGMFLSELKAAEERLCQRALVTIVRGNADATALASAGLSMQPPPVIPTGVAPDPSRYRTANQRRSAKSAMNMDNRSVAIFESDASVESIAAMLRLTPIALTCPDVLFLISGRCMRAEYPPNMRFFDDLTVSDCSALRAIADVAVVPYVSMTGTCAQIIDFVRAGVPIVASEAACINLPLESERDCLLGSDVTLPSLLQRVISDPDLAEGRAVAAYATLIAAAPPTLTAINFKSLIEQLPVGVAASA